VRILKAKEISNIHMFTQPRRNLDLDIVAIMLTFSSSIALDLNKRRIKEKV
jgi:hypothetical protein